MKDNINVKPDVSETAVPVATDVVGGVHVPVYKAAYGEDGELILVDDSGLPIHLSQEAKVQQERIIDLLFDNLQQQKITNLHLESMTSDHFTKDDIED